MAISELVKGVLYSLVVIIVVLLDCRLATVLCSNFISSAVIVGFFFGCGVTRCDSGIFLAVGLLLSLVAINPYRILGNRILGNDDRGLLALDPNRVCDR